MPRYYFNVIDGVTVPDQEGIFLENQMAALDYAKDLADRLRNKVPELRASLVVTDGEGTEIYSEIVDTTHDHPQST